MDYPYPKASGRPRLFVVAPPNPTGICGCGCGRTTPIAAKTHSRRGYVAGEHVRFLPGHARRAVHLPTPHPLRDDDWFAGFADGEGCFFITLDGSSHRVGFSISLRADDAAILGDLRTAFGGSLGPVRARGNAREKCQWSATSAASLRALIDYFDAHPLRAKKARDYTVWRRAALARIELDPAGRETTLAGLAAELGEARAFQEAA